MPGDGQHLNEGASVQITPAPTPATDPNAAPAAPAQPSEDTRTVKSLNPLQKLAGALLSLVLLASLACGIATPTTAPSHSDTSAIDDGNASVQTVERPSFVPANVPFISTGNPADEPTHYRLELTLAKCLGEVAVCTPDQAYAVQQDHDNLLTTAGATALWNGLSTAGLATPFNTTNAQLAVGDGTTAAAVGDTDLGAAAGSTLAISGATNASPIVLTTATNTFTAGQTVVVTGVGGDTNANGTWEVSAATSTTVTLLNSSGNAAYTSGGTIAPINKYRQQANGTGSAVVSGNQITFVSTVGTANGNFHWQEWMLSTGAAATNKQASPPPTAFNHKIVDLGTKTSSASWTLTASLQLS